MRSAVMSRIIIELIVLGLNVVVAAVIAGAHLAANSQVAYFG
jgi:hypothetical protein